MGNLCTEETVSMVGLQYQSLQMRSIDQYSAFSIDIGPTRIPLLLFNQQLQAQRIQLDINGERVIKQFKDAQNRFNMVDVQFGDRGSVLSMIFIDDLTKDQTYMVVFAGIQRDNKKQKGIYLTIKPREVTIFKGSFQENRNIGFKLTKTNNTLEKHWGEFNNTYQAQGKGSNVILTKKQEGVQQQYFQGTFLKGGRQGSGKLKINFDSHKDVIDKMPFHLLLLIQAELLKSHRNIKRIANKMVQFIILDSQYKPQKPQPQADQYFNLIVSSNWKNNLIQGLAQQFWPKENIHFEGIYKNNQRNGYGQQYQYDMLTAKGFYKDGIMQTDQDNQYLLMGFKLEEESWVRKNINEQQLMAQ